MSINDSIEMLADFSEAHPYVLLGIVYLMMGVVFLCGWFDVLGVGR